MALAPVIKDGSPLFIDSGGGVLVPAHAEDPCDCDCGGTCGNCTGVMPDFVDITLSGFVDEGGSGCDCTNLNGVYRLERVSPTSCIYRLDVDIDTCGDGFSNPYRLGFTIFGGSTNFEMVLYTGFGDPRPQRWSYNFTSVATSCTGKINESTGPLDFTSDTLSPDPCPSSTPMYSAAAA